MTPTATFTASPTFEGLQGTVAAIGTYAAQLEAGLNAAAAQETANAAVKDPVKTEAAQSTQSSQFGQFQTFAVGQLTGIPGTLTAVANGGGFSPGVVGTASPTPSPVVTPLPPQVTPAGTQLGQLAPGSRNVSYMVQPANPQRPVRQDEVTATVAAIYTQIGQLEAAGTANAFQATLNGQLYQGTYPPFVQTQLAQINAGGTAISLQLTLNAFRLTGTPGKGTPTETRESNATALPNGGIFDDIAAGGALSGAGLAIFGIAALGLIVVIAVSRRMRVQE